MPVLMAVILPNELQRVGTTIEFNGYGGEMYLIYILYYKTCSLRKQVGFVCVLSHLQFPFLLLLFWISFFRKSAAFDVVGCSISHTFIN